VGHYGLFSGSKFRKYIVPLICDVAQRSQQKPKSQAA
jgi:poly-beta-hydroxyalkanoate depolymerase